MGKRASKCTSCMNVCLQTTSKQSRACKLHCPYILLPPREYAVKIVKDPLKDDIVTAVVEDNKYITLVVISAFAFIIIFNVGIGVVCYRKNLLCFHRNARQINRHEIEMDIMQSFPLPDNVAVPETGGHGDNEPIQRHADGATQRLLDNLPSAEEYGQDRDGQHEPRDFLKNENEEEMNHLALGEPPMIDVQTGKCFGTRQSEDMI
ncbi:uncharacterized protein LOC123550163 [Mercenaria mercenaria]|uniref:uncharacterized protein LOC123550163 n=1 Tax=Mercenaria mercenaria TaxID=6596 RepID=UPI00234EA876|nr:uncharacterized protein LOC123550163 [Mercenaria mercenaria]XP_053401672.1 uncharacterized protein LOC123550163 [Mercenaria mercenaria]